MVTKPNGHEAKQRTNDEKTKRERNGNETLITTELTVKRTILKKLINKRCPSVYAVV